MRLRPSGRQGPVATSLQSFRSYQQDEAWTWEHLALTRARPLVGDAGLLAEIEAFRRALLIEKRQNDRIRPDAAAMRLRLHAAKPADAPWEAKDGPGRLMDIELLAQTAALLAGSPARETRAQLRAGASSGFIKAGERAILEEALALCWSVQAAGRLLTEAPLDPESLGEGGRAFVVRAADVPDPASLTSRLEAQTSAAAAIIAAKLDPALISKGTEDAGD